jgi:thioredoxin 2
MDTVLLRCQSCGTINRVLKEKLTSSLKCGNCNAQLEYPHNPVEVTISTFVKEVLSWPGAVLVEFWSTTCVYCRMLSPVLDQIATEKAGILKIVKINTDSNQQMVFDFSIQGTPYLILYQGGKKLSEVAGALPKNQLISWIESSLSL